MPKIDFKQVNGVKVGNVNVKALKHGNFLWQEPTVMTIAHHYGTSAGQVPIHHKPSVMSNLTIDANNFIIGSTNLGGAGSYFDLASTSANAPAYSDNSFFFNNGEAKYLNFSNYPDFAGVHAIAAIKIGPLSNPYLSMFNNSLWQRVYIRTTTNPFRFTAMKTDKSNAISGTIAKSTTEWIIVELRMDSYGTSIFVNGVKTVGNTAVTPGYIIQAIGNNSTQNQPTVGNMGDFASVICDPAHNSNQLEQAVITARKEIAKTYNVTVAP